MKSLLFFVAMLTITTATWAAKAKPGLRTNTQSDGTTIQFTAHGDEDFNYLITTDGVLLVGNGTDLFIAATNSDGTLTATTQIAHEAALRTEAEQALIAKQDKELFFGMAQTTKRMSKATRAAELDIEGTTLFPHKGSPRAVVLLVDFTDTKFTLSDPYAKFDKYLNSTEYFDDDDTDMGVTTKETEHYRNYGSVKKYFEDMSFGQYSPQFDLYGPYSLDYPTSNFSGTSNMRGLLTSACEAANADIDFSEYDENGDGYIDLVYIIYAGYAQSVSGNSNDIWPNSGTVSVNTTFDGKKIARYGVNSELNFSSTDDLSGNINGIGLFCHEFSHCLGLPDLYPSSTGTEIADKYGSQNPELWSLMDAGEYTLQGYVPTAYTAWERERMGWMTIDTLSEAANITLHTLSQAGSNTQTGKAYKILNDENPDEYYILENIQSEGWNEHIGGHGMTVMHVDFDESWFSLYSMPNSVGGKPKMTLIPADNLIIPMAWINEEITSEQSQYSETAVERYLGQTITSKMYLNEHGGDPFPGTYGVTSLTDTTTPAATVYTSSGRMSKPITDIAENDGVVTFKFLGGSDTGISSIGTENESTKRIYTLDGRYLGTDTSKLRKGMYIIGKKKVVF